MIAISTIVMVLELRFPHGTGIHALRPLVPIGLTYVLSRSVLGIYWNNHHHMLRATEHVNGEVLWANLYLLFWLSLSLSRQGGWRERVRRGSLMTPPGSPTSSSGATE